MGVTDQTMCSSRRARGQTSQSIAIIDDDESMQDSLPWSTQELQRSAFYFAEAQRLGHMGGWVFGPTKGFDYWSHELLEIHGLDPAAEAPS
jgi:hypothetical protein